MQKKLIALAVAGMAAAPAFAQSNVTIYGVADATYDSISVHGASDSDYNVGRYSRVSTNSSLIGFKGTEDLGNGLKALFQFESTVGFDAGGDLNAARDSYVGVTGGFGTVLLGNLTGPTRALGAALDVNAGATGIGANSGLLGKLSNILVNGTDANSNFTPFATCGRSTTCASLFDTRWKNSVAYVSPNFSGVTGTVAYVANENKTRDGLRNTGGEANTWGYDLGVKYANGPIMAAMTYNKVNLGWNDDPKVADFRIGAMYDFGIASVRVVYDRVKLDSDGFDTRQTVWGIGGTFNVTPAGKVLAQYYKAGDLKGDGWSDSGAKLFSVGYEHSLSKRTMLKASYSKILNDDFASYDYGINAAGITNTNAEGAHLTGFSAGIRHLF